MQQVPLVPSSSLCASPRRILLPPQLPSPPSPVLTPRPVLLWPKGQPLASPSVVHPALPASGHHTQGSVWRPCGRFSFSLGAGASSCPKAPNASSPVSRFLHLGVPSAQTRAPPGTSHCPLSTPLRHLADTPHSSCANLNPFDCSPHRQHTPPFFPPASSQGLRVRS